MFKKQQEYIIANNVMTKKGIEESEVKILRELLYRIKFVRCYENKTQKRRNKI